MEKWNIPCRYSALRVAYIDETEETKDGKSQKVYYSVLVKGGDKYDEVWTKHPCFMLFSELCFFPFLTEFSFYCLPVQYFFYAQPIKNYARYVVDTEIMIRIIQRNSENKLITLKIS